MIIDLTMPINENTPVYTGNPKVEIQHVALLEKNGWNEKRITLNSHAGTHIDAPKHMLAEGKTLDDFPMSKYIGDAIVLDARNIEIIDVSLEHVKPNDIVFFCTEYSQNALKPDYFNYSPVYSERMAQELVDKKISITGIDSFTTDLEPLTIHKLFFSNDIMILENLTNLSSLIGKRFQCIIAPLKISDADGAPCRVYAIV